MSRLQQLAHMFRLPEAPSGVATWSSTDLMGSKHRAVISWDEAAATLGVEGSVDDLPSFNVQFRVAAGSLRIVSSSGMPPDISGAKGTSQYLASLFMQGPAPVAAAPAARLTP
jgi:hypothetical protein